MQTPFHTVGLVGKYDNQGMETSVRVLGEFLRGRGHAVLLACQTAEHLGVDDMFGAVAEILSGQYVAEERILLNGQIRRGGECVFEATAFNDVVVGKGGSGRLIDLEISINSEFGYRQRAEGRGVPPPH